MGRRSRFVPIRRKRAVEADPTDDSATAPLEEPSAEHQSGIHWVSKATAALQYFAKLLWLPDYTELFLIEFDQNLREAGSSGVALRPSTYRARLKGEAAERYDFRRLQQKRDQLACELHANNQQHWSPSLLLTTAPRGELGSTRPRMTQSLVVLPRTAPGGQQGRHALQYDQLQDIVHKQQLSLDSGQNHDLT